MFHFQIESKIKDTFSVEKVFVFFLFLQRLSQGNEISKQQENSEFAYPADAVSKNWTKILVLQLEHDFVPSNIKVICEYNEKIDKIQLSLITTEFVKNHPVSNIISRDLFL